MQRKDDTVQCLVSCYPTLEFSAQKPPDVIMLVMLLVADASDIPDGYESIAQHFPIPNGTQMAKN